MRNILVIKCGETFPEIKEKYGNFEDWIIKQSNLPERVFKIYDLPEGDQLRHPSEYIAAIITGSHTNVNQRLPWIKQLKDWIVTARYSNVPVLGICFGHQIIAEALGGKVVLNPNGPALGPISIKLTEAGQNDPLFKKIGDSFESYAFHSFSITELPLGALSLAQSGNMIEAFKVEKIYGVQFHPEYDDKIMKMYFEISKTKEAGKNRVKIKSDFKNQTVISNFFDISLKF